MWLQLKRREALEGPGQRGDGIKHWVQKAPSGYCWGKARGPQGQKPGAQWGGCRLVWSREAVEA